MSDEELFPREALVPIAQALATCALNRDVELDTLEPHEQDLHLKHAERLLLLSVPALSKRVAFNIALTARCRAIADDAILTITQQPINASLETRRAVILRALRITNGTADRVPMGAHA